MAITIDLPQVGESVVEGIIGKWLKQPGDPVEKYDLLVEVVTDKVTMELPSPVAGVMGRILAQEGETVPMGAAIAEIETDEAQAAGAVPHSPVPASAEGVSTTGYLVKESRPVGPTGGGVEEAPSTAVAPLEPGEEGARYSPAVRRLAAERDVDLGRITGTGLGGRVTRKDVLKYAEESAARAPAATPRASEARPAGQAEAPGDTVLALTPVRRIIAQNMVRSATEIPHAWTMVEVDVSGLVVRREAVKEEFQQREGVELTYLPFVIQAAVESLKGHPRLNSAWSSDKIILKGRINVGIAVAAPEGLVVPVIHDADALSIAGLAKAARELTGRARQGKLGLPDVQGGTFTVNNTGALGSVVSYPIINYPQAAILTSEAIQKRPVVVHDAIAIRSMMNICLSFDHRIVDGAESGAFLQSVKRHLEAIGPETPIY